MSVNFPCGAPCFIRNAFEQPFLVTFVIRCTVADFCTAFCALMRRIVAVHPRCTFFVDCPCETSAFEPLTKQDKVEIAFNIAFFAGIVAILGRRGNIVLVGVAFTSHTDA